MKLRAGLLILLFAAPAWALPPAVCGSARAAPSIPASPPSLSFAITQGGSAASSGVTFTDNNTAQSWSASASSSPTNWLGINPGSGSGGSFPGGLTATATPGSLAPGTYSGTITVIPSTSCNDGKAPNVGSPTQIGVTLTINPPPSISLSASPSAVVMAPGGSAQVSLGLTRNNFTGSVSIAVSGTPGSVTASVNPIGTGTSGSITFQASGNAAPISNQSVTITASGSGVSNSSASVTVSIMVNSSISISPSTNAVVLAPGGTQSVDIALSRTSYSGTVTLAVSGLPQGVTATTVDPGTGSAGSVMLQASSSAPASSNQNITVTASGAGVTSATTSFFLSIVPAVTVSISAQPVGRSITAGQTATLTVSVSGGTSFNYSWYQGTSGNTSTPVRSVTSSSSTSDSFTTPALTATTSYWVRVGNGNNTVDSSTATVTVTAVASPLTIVTQPSSGSLQSGMSAGLSVSVSGGSSITYSYTWYQGAAGNTSTPVRNIPSSTSTQDTYTTPALTATTSYWVRIGNATSSIDSAVATITVTVVSSPVSITTQPSSVTLASGQTATFSVTATGGPALTYNWYSGVSGNKSTLVKSSTSNSFTTPALTATTSYWAQVSNGSNSANSSTATATVPVNFAMPSTGTCATSFYKALGTLPVGETEGVFGMTVAIPQGLLAGGFNLGGGFAEPGGPVGFGQFKMPSSLPPASVQIIVNAQPLGAGVVRLLMTLNKVNSDGTRNLIQTTNGVPPLTINTGNLDAGTFYVVEVSGLTGAPRGTYQLQLIAPSGGFEGGVVAGGFAIQGIDNYGAFCLPVPQTVNVKVESGATYGTFGSGNLTLKMVDSAGTKVFNPTP